MRLRKFIKTFVVALVLVLVAASGIGADTRWVAAPPLVVKIDLADPVVKETLDQVAKEFSYSLSFGAQAGYDKTYEWFWIRGAAAEAANKSCSCGGYTYPDLKQVIVLDIPGVIPLHILAHEAVHVLQSSYGVLVPATIAGVYEKAAPDEKKGLFSLVAEEQAERVSRWAVDLLIKNSEQFRKAIGVK